MGRLAAVAVALGAVLLLGGFAAGSEPGFLGGTSCHAVLHPGVATFQGRCPQGVNVPAVLAVWGVLGLGAALVLSGWTAGRDGGSLTDRPRPRTG